MALFKLSYSLHVLILAITSLCLVSKSYSRTLIPIRREIGNSKRAPSADSLLPRASVVVDYGFDTFEPTHASVVVEAHADRPILLLETLDSAVVQSITCHSDAELSIISLTLHSEEMVRETVHAWARNGYTAFNVITSHVGCNAGDERGAWSVSSINTNERTITLLASPLPFQDVGKTFSVSLRDHTLGGHWTPNENLNLPQRMPEPEGRLGKRDFEATGTAVLTSNLSGKQIFPGNSSLLGLASDTIQDLTSASLEITCTECTSKFNFTTGVDFTFTPGVVGITSAVLFTSVLQFDSSVVLDISVKKTLEKDFSFDVLKVPIDGFTVPGLFAIGPFIGVSVDFNFTISGEVDFTMGANASVPAKANSTSDLITPGNSVATGWDAVTFNTIPVRINGGAPNFTIGGALSPFIEFDLNVGAGNGTTGLTARLSQTLPAIELEFTSLSNVNGACQPAGDADFSLFGAAYTVQGTVGLLTTASVDVNDAGLLETVGLDAAPSWSATLFEHNFNILGGTPDENQTCFVVADDGGPPKNPAAAPPKATATAPASSKHPAATGTLLSAPSAIPTYDISKIQSYASSHNNMLPPGITLQMLQGSGQQLPDGFNPSGTTPSDNSTNSNVDGGGSGGSSSALRSWNTNVYFIAVVCAFVAALI